MQRKKAKGIEARDRNAGSWAREEQGGRWRSDASASASLLSAESRLKPACRNLAFAGEWEGREVLEILDATFTRRIVLQTASNGLAGRVACSRRGRCLPTASHIQHSHCQNRHAHPSPDMEALNCGEADLALRWPDRLRWRAVPPRGLASHPRLPVLSAFSRVIPQLRRAALANGKFSFPSAIA